MRRPVLLFAVAALAVAVLAGGISAFLGSGRSTRWVIADLGTVSGPSSYALALNDRGQVVGYGNAKDGSQYGFLWQDGKMTDMPDTTNTVAINARGQAVGFSGPRAFLWQNGKMTDLDTPDDMVSYALAINDRGQIIGNWHAWDNTGYQAFLWEKGRIVRLGTRAGAESGISEENGSFAINDRGHVVGWSRTGSQAVLWKNGAAIDPGTLGGRQSDAVAISDRGEVIGTSDTGAKGTNGDPIQHGFLWWNGRMRDFGNVLPSALNNRGQVVGGTGTHAFLWRDGDRIDLGTLGGTQSHAVAINDRGQIIGNSTTTDGRRHAFLWQNEAMTDLGTLGGNESRATALNENGEIVGSSQTKSGRWHAVLWTPRRGTRSTAARRVPTVSRTAVS